MVFGELIVIFLLPLIPTILFYRFTRAKVKGKIFGIDFSIAGAGAMYGVVFILTFYLYYLYGSYQEQKETLVLRVIPEPYNVKMASILSLVWGLKVELCIKNEKPLEFAKLSNKEGYEYLEQSMEVPRRYFGMEAEVKIYPESIFKQNKSMVTIKRLVKLKAPLDEEKLRCYLHFIKEKLNSFYNHLEAERHQEPL